MAAVTVTKHIQAPVERVFDIATDLHNAPKTIRGITKLEVLTDGPIGVGARFKETRTMFGREATEEMEVTAFERPHRYALGCDNHGCRYHTEVRCTPNGAGAILEMEFRAQPLTFLAKMMAFLMRPMLKSCAKAMEDDLEDIKAAAEAKAAGDV